MSKPLTARERRRFTRWLGQTRAQRSKKRVQVCWTFELAGGDVRPDDIILFTELADKIATAALDEHDIGAIRLRRIVANGEVLV